MVRGRRKMHVEEFYPLFPVSSEKTGKARLDLRLFFSCANIFEDWRVAVVEERIT